MADNKKWFKVWTSLLNDEGFENLSDDLIGKWTRLGARTALIGTSGQCRFLSKESFTRFMRAKTFENAVSIVQKLPNLTVSYPPKNDNAVIIVTHFKKWKKYQEDSTGYERVKRYRQKKQIDNGTREEEKRGEKKRREERITEDGQNVDNFLNSKKYSDSKSTKYSKKKPTKIDPDVSKLGIPEPSEETKLEPY